MGIEDRRLDPCRPAATLPGEVPFEGNPDRLVRPSPGRAEAVSTGVQVGVDLVQEFEVAGEAASEILGAFGLPLAIRGLYLDFHQGIVLAARDGAVRGMLREALGGDDIGRASPGRQLAFAAALSGLNGTDPATVRLRDSLPHDQRAAFERTFEELSARSRSATFRAELAEARTQYRRVTREYGSGVTAALEGWPASALRGRSEACRAGHERTLRWAAEHPEEAAQARAIAQACKTQGFLDCAGGRAHIDRARYESDPSYRSGVEAANQLRQDVEGGGDAAVQERARELRRQLPVTRATAMCPVRG